MKPEKRYDMIMIQKDKWYIEVGFGTADGFQHMYYICHSCKDGLKSFQGEATMMIKMIEHIASESHKILLGDY